MYRAKQGEAEAKEEQEIGLGFMFGGKVVARM